jgi:hypothetical protein
MSLCYFAFLFLSWENQMIHGNILVLFNAAWFLVFQKKNPTLYVLCLMLSLSSLKYFVVWNMKNWKPLNVITLGQG